MSSEIDQTIKEKEEAFIKSRKNANNLADIALMLEGEESNYKQCILSLKSIFVHILVKRAMFVEKQDSAQTAETQYRDWLRDIYETTLKRLINIMDQCNPVLQSIAFDTLMRLMTLEGQYPLEMIKSEEYYFPSHRLQQIVLALLSSTKSTKNLIMKFAEFTQYQDVIYYAWKLMPSNIHKIIKPNELFVKNFLDLVDKIAPKKNIGDEDAQLLLASEGGLEFSLNLEHVRQWMNKTWRCVMKWEHTSVTHKQLMVVLLEKILPHLKQPFYLTDYFMGAMDMGGAVSVLALQGMLTLIQNYNLDYPNIYGKLYTMIEPEIFHMKYKPRLFHLTDLFLTSSHLPQTIVAAFAKRMARLCLIAPPQDIQIMLAFIGNLLIRHPGLKKLLVGSPSDPEIANDPYNMNEADPTKSRAIDSFLWEIYNLQRHYLPSIANAATQLVNAPLPSVEWDLGELLEITQDDIFDKELKKKPKEITLTYDKPQSLRLPQGEKVLQYWTLT